MYTIIFMRWYWWLEVIVRCLTGIPLVLPIYRSSREESIVCLYYPFQLQWFSNIISRKIWRIPVIIIFVFYCRLHFYSCLQFDFTIVWSSHSPVNIILMNIGLIQSSKIGMDIKTDGRTSSEWGSMKNMGKLER